MLLKRLFSIVIIFVFFLSIPGFSQTKNRVAVSEADRIKLYEFNSSNQEFDLVWESVNINLDSHKNTQNTQIEDLHIIDIDDDGNCELIAVDHYGIFIWGKNGKFPRYFPFQGSLAYYSNNRILAIDIDRDTRIELLTQRMNRDGETRLITVWKIESNRLFPLNEIELPGTASWSLRRGDFDGDGKTEILTSANLIHILGWNDETGLIIEAEIPNLSGVIDNVRPADIDDDGIDEIIASGNSGVFSVYKHRKIHEKNYYPLYFQNMIEPGKKRAPTQGLHFGDIDGDDIYEILVGLATFRREKDVNISIYKQIPDTDESNFSGFRFEKEFSMLHDSSFIPGFVIGDVDNDGQNEVIYNNKYVLKFHIDDDGNISSESLGEISQRADGVAIGPFYPSGENVSNSIRIIPQILHIDLNDSEIIEPGKNYKIWVKVISLWKEAKNVSVKLKSEMEDIKVLNDKFQVPLLEEGKTYDNSSDPFLISVKGITKSTDFSLKVELSAEDGYLTSESFPLASSSEDHIYFFRALPKLEVTSDTLAFSTETDIYEDLGISYDHFDDEYSSKAWPQTDVLYGYKNLIIFTGAGTLIYFKGSILSSFLDQGGNCLVHGDNALQVWGSDSEIKENMQIIATYFRSKYVEDFKGEKDVIGKPEDLISAGLSLHLKDSKWGPPDVLEALPGAIPILFYPSGEVAGVRFEGKYKLVYLGFSLDDIQETEVKKELVKRIMDWFDQE